ncbi:MAG: bifunctional diguanylate cyclase/phosphodiesterase, partial [Phototrophicales bacterium]
MNIKALTELLEAQQDISTMIALQSPLDDILECACNHIESILQPEQAFASILLLNGEQLYHGAAPSLDRAYCEAINGVRIGENVGSCGT